jgi:STAS domain
MHAARPPVNCAVIDAKAMTHVDSTGLEALRELKRKLEGEGVQLLLARVKQGVAMRLADAGVSEELGADNFYPTVRAAVEACVKSQSSPEERSGEARAQDGFWTDQTRYTPPPVTESCRSAGTRLPAAQTVPHQSGGSSARPQG